MKSKRICTIAVFLLLSFSVFAQKVAVTASVTEEKILLGQPFQLTLQARLPPGKTVDWFRTDTFPHFEVLSRSRIDTQNTGAVQTLVQTLHLTSWDSGRWQLPSFSLRGSNRTRPIAVDVVFTEPFDPKQEYHDVKDNLDVERPERTTWHWYLVGLGLLLLLFWLLFPGRRKKKGEPVSDAGAYKDALAQLEGLGKKADSAENKVFYTELIQVLREYLRRRKGIPSHSRTTEDIALQGNSLGLPGAESNKFLQELRLSDLVKFARFNASAADRQRSLQVVRQSIAAMEEKEVQAAGKN